MTNAAPADADEKQQSEEQRHMLSEQVYQAIIRLVIQGELRRGAPLRIDDLSRRLAVSPTPVREGLTRLEMTGLVVHEPRRGFRVAPPLTAAQFDRLMDARELLEIGAAGLAIAAGDAGFVPALRAALEAQRRAVEAFHSGPSQASDVEWEVIDTDLAFHRVVFEYTRNSYLQAMSDALSGQSHRARQSADRGVSDDLEAVEEHAVILRAAESGDRGAVESAMRMHLRLVRSRAIDDFVDSERKLSDHKFSA